MNEHTRISELLPLYVSGALDREQRLIVEKHLPTCGECQADLALWESVSAEVVSSSQAAAAPRSLADQALARIRQGQVAKTPPPAAGGLAPLTVLAFGLRRALHLLRSQMPLVQREIWPASAAVVGLGYIAAAIAAQASLIYALAPLIAAACVALIYGPENDPAYELALSTPTSPRQILLARLVLVFGYNLGLILVALVGLLPVVNQPLLGEVMLAWLAPMTFLSALALVLSLWVGAPNAISIAYVAWLGHLLTGPLRLPQVSLELRLTPLAVDALAAYQTFWQAPALLLALSALLFAAAIWLAGRQSHGLLYPA